MKNQKVDIPIPQSSFGANWQELSEDVLRDKVLGALVGSAIGDAMGASTEMWHRSQIQEKYGYITGLTAADRFKSPEGTWQDYMQTGSTTDDTRWKYLVSNYFQHSKGALSANGFASFIRSYYEDRLDEIASEKVKASTDALDREMDKVNWIKEWARVAIAYQAGSDAYALAMNRFYGGELSCAGMLYSPMFGLIAKNEEEAYNTAYEHALFDLGYARDISSSLAVMTFLAMHEHDMDSLLNKTMKTDPLRFRDSRLIGRIAEFKFNDARSMVRSVRSMEVSQDMEINVPTGYPETAAEWYQESLVCDKLEKEQEKIAFHSGEIWQILIAGLEFGQGNFERTMQFIVNYGRDNDTVAAVAGMVLGAQLGFSQLPAEMREKVLEVSRENMGMDLEVATNWILAAKSQG